MTHKVLSGCTGRSFCACNAAVSCSTCGQHTELLAVSGTTWEDCDCPLCRGYLIGQQETWRLLPLLHPRQDPNLQTQQGPDNQSRLTMCLTAHTGDSGWHASEGRSGGGVCGAAHRAGAATGEGGNADRHRDRHCCTGRAASVLLWRWRPCWSPAHALQVRSCLLTLRHECLCSVPNQKCEIAGTYVVFIVALL